MDRGLGLAIACAALSAGCGPLLGLDPPSLAPADATNTPPPVDTDGDGVLDATDNCPSIPNTDQTDSDDNRIGDACEGCIVLALRTSDDDDSDMINDPTDTCFGKSGAGTDGDSDGIGDACDPRNGKDTRFCVWTFRNPDAGEAPDFWTSNWTLGADWTIKDSILSHTAGSLGTTAAPLGASFGAAGGIAFDTLIHISGFTTPMTEGVSLASVTQPQESPTFSCQFVVPSGAMAPAIQLLRDGAVIKQQSIPTAIPQNLTFYVRFGVFTQMSNATVRCTVELGGSLGMWTLMQGASDTIDMLQPRVYADQVNIDVDDLVLYKLGT